jgi:hypothetical protein
MSDTFLPSLFESWSQRSRKARISEIKVVISYLTSTQENFNLLFSKWFISPIQVKFIPFFYKKDFFLLTVFSGCETDMPQLKLISVP